MAAPASVFGTTSLGAGTGLGAGAGSGTAGLGGANARTPLPSEATNFTLPGGYGQAPLSFSVGSGRLARPRYVFTGTAQLGYDDNILQTPTSTRGQAEVRQEVVVTPATPDEVVVVNDPPAPGSNSVGVRPDQTSHLEVIKGKPAETKSVVVIPAIPAQKRVGSFVARSGVGFEMQMASRRTVFTVDAHVNAEYYTNRPGDASNYSGNLALIYAHRISSRMQFSASVSVAYLNQPDLRIVSGPTRNVGDYFNGSAKFDLTYRWTKRFSTVSSLSLSTLLYTESVQAINNSYETLFGTEGRYLWSRRLTVVLEGRYGQSFYPDQELRNSSTIFLLVGADFALSARLSSTVRVGEAIRSFDSGDGGSKASPYLESSTSYQYSQTGSLSWSNRFGFEEPQDASSEVLVFRTSLSTVKTFTSRLRGSLSVGYIHRVTDQSANISVPEIVGDTYTADIGLDYALTRKFSVSASYSFVRDDSSLDEVGYYRNQIFLGAQYTF